MVSDYNFAGYMQRNCSLTPLFEPCTIILFHSGGRVLYSIVRPSSALGNGDVPLVLMR